MKKYFILGILSVFLIISVGIVYADQIKYFSFKEPSNAEEALIKERIDNEISNFKKAVNDDISNVFNLNLNGYSKISINELTKIENQSISRIFGDILKQQKEGDILPTIFINGNQGYILEKKGNGHNYLYIITYDKEWSITSIMDKEGKVISFEEINAK